MMSILRYSTSSIHVYYVSVSHSYIHTMSVISFSIQYLPPGRPNGISLHDIILTTDSVTTSDDVMEVDVFMEIIPATCDYDIPLIGVEVNSTSTGETLWRFAS